MRLCFSLSGLTLASLTYVCLLASFIVPAWRTADAAGLGLALDGANDYARSNATVYPTSSSPQSFTAEAWIYPTAIGNQTIAADDAYDLSIFYQSGVGGGVAFSLRGPGGTSTGRAYDLQYNHWNHVAAIYDALSGQQKVSLNGSLNSFAYGNAAFFNDPTYNFVIGQSGFNSAYFNGKIDEVRISGVARYTSNFTPANTFSTDADTKALYHFDEPIGSTSFIDSAGNGNTLTGFNGAQTAAIDRPTILPGDFNANGVVDAADYTVWRDHLGSTFGLNGNGEETGASAGVVDQADYTLWKTNFGHTASGSAAAANGSVPEPASLSLAAIGIVGGFLSRRCRGTRYHHHALGNAVEEKWQSKI